MEASSLTTDFCGFKNKAHRAGVKVKAQIADRAIDTEIVMANCLYNWPVEPPIKDTGINTAASTKAIATTGPLTSLMAR